jgi:hypothetical protein
MNRFTNLGILSFLNPVFIPLLFKLKLWDLIIKTFFIFFLFSFPSQSTSIMIKG